MTETIVSEHIILNGRLLKRDHAQISIFNQALFYSFGVYESIEIDAGVLFHLDDHLKRLYQSAQMIELPLPNRPDTIREWVHALVEKDQITEALLRLMAFGPNDHEDTLIYLLPMRLPHYPSTFYTLGANAITYPGSRPLPQAKTLNTLVNYLALRCARSAGAHEAFLINHDGCLTEGSRSNLFVVSDNTLITPAAEQVLSGITRDLILKLAEVEGMPVRESAIPKDDLPQYEEIFVTSTSMHVVPIVCVDGQPVGKGRIGPITQGLMHSFEAYYAQVVGREIVPMPI